MRQLNQKGFSPVETLLVVVAIVIVGAVGLYVLHSQSNAEDNLNAASAASQSQPVVKKKATGASTKDSNDPIETTYSKAPAALQQATRAPFPTRAVRPTIAARWSPY